MCLALIHELGHVMAGIILGFKPESISIIPTGFSVKFKNDCKNYNKKIKNGNMLALKKAIIAFAGPLVNLINYGNFNNILQNNGNFRNSWHINRTINIFKFTDIYI